MKLLLPRESHMKEGMTSYLMLFCALMMAQKSKATLEEAIGVVPLVGNAEYLAHELLV